VLLRRKKYAEALAVMKAALPESRGTHSFHNKIGFVAHYLRCLNHTSQHRTAENYAETYLRAFRKEIFEHRWHAFFIAYLETLLAQNNYLKIGRTIEKYQLLKRDETYVEKGAYLPTIPWFHTVSALKMHRITGEKARAALLQSLESLTMTSDKVNQINELLLELQLHVPELVEVVRGRL